MKRPQVLFRDGNHFVDPTEMESYCIGAEDTIAALEGRVRALVRALEKLLAAKDCLYCPNQGWWQGTNRHTGEHEQIQCEYCYTQSESVFNQRINAAAILRKHGKTNHIVEGGMMKGEETRLPNWWPQNPYPVDIFTLDDRDVYVKAIPDEKLRTAISGMLGRKFWQIASDAIWRAMQEMIAEKEEDEPCASPAFSAGGAR